MIPSNSLAAVYGIAADCAERQVLGPDVAIDIAVTDETNTHIDVPALLAGLSGPGAVRGALQRVADRLMAAARPGDDAPDRRRFAARLWGPHRRQGAPGTSNRLCPGSL